MPKDATGETGLPSEKRNKTERPRDELGRPLAWDAKNRMRLEDFDNRPLDENHELARAHARAGRWFPAHEAWETCWKQARDTEEAEFFKGLSQMGAGYVHLLRGNDHGAVTLLRRAARRVGLYAPRHRGIDAAELSRRLEADAGRIERGELVPGESATVSPPAV